MKVYELEETADGTMEVKGRARGEKGAKAAEIRADNHICKKCGHLQIFNKILYFLKQRGGRMCP